jgi:hypothetical protein
VTFGHPRPRPSPSSKPPEEIRRAVAPPSAIRRNALEVLGLRLAEGTTAADAIAAVRARLGGRELTYACGRCRAPTDATLPRCWACGADLDDAPESPPELSLEELQRRARVLQLPPEVVALPRERLVEEIDREENRRRAAGVRGPGRGEERRRILAWLTEAMPDCWRISRHRAYTAFRGPPGKIHVFETGIAIHFVLADPTALEGVAGARFVDADERRRRHLGRTNFELVDLAALEAVATRVFALA